MYCVTSVKYYILRPIYFNVYGSFHGQEYFLVSSEIFTNLTSAFCFNRKPEQSSGLLLPERSAKMVVLSKLVNHAAGFLPVPMVVLQAGTHTLHLVAENLPRDVGGRFRKVTQDEQTNSVRSPRNIEDSGMFSLSGHLLEKLPGMVRADRIEPKSRFRSRRSLVGQLFAVDDVVADQLIQDPSV